VDDLRALIEAVRLKPEDQACKLVLADYLQERGNEWAGRGLRLMAGLDAVISPFSSQHPALREYRWVHAWGHTIRAESYSKERTFEGALHSVIASTIEWNDMGGQK
jgi:uncharacterized protein (TIGR02996 family)